MLVMDAAFLDIPHAEKSRYEHVSLAKRHGYVFRQLVDRGVFHRQTLFDYQGACQQKGVG